MKLREVKQEAQALLKHTAFVVTDPRFVTVNDDPNTCFAMDVTTPEQVLEAADNSYHKHVVLPYTDLVVKTLLTHSLYGKIFIVVALHEDLVAHDSIAKKYNLDPITLYPARPEWTDVVNQLFQYVSSPD